MCSYIFYKETMIFYRSVFIVVFAFSFAMSSIIKSCDRKPIGISTPKSIKPHSFRIAFKGNVDSYVPGTTYTVLLQSMKSVQTITPSFTSFMMIVEADDYRNYDDDNNDFIAGKFLLTGDVRTKISEVCPNTVIHSSNIPKSEVQVFWTAPSSGSGCVVFRATIVEYQDLWYMDDQQLTKKICEENNESNDDNVKVVYECCACDEAKFELTFEGLWSRHTHPKDYPDNWETRFSDVIGASHTIDYRFWEQGKVTSEGMNNIAQNGTTSSLESELKSKSDKIRTIIKARGISYPNVTGKTFAVFRVDRDHHLISVVSFMYPSPDWFVGISGMELCLPNCNWITNKTINLYPWDAGIDSGVTYNSSDMPQVPRMNVQRVWSPDSNDERSPFYVKDPLSATMKPIAKLHIMRQRLYEKSCSEDEPKAESAVCDTGPWSDWDECSATCGKGYSNRNRQFINPEDTYKPHCNANKQLTQRKGCFVLPSCLNDIEEKEIMDPKCDVTAFGQWSDCSAECGPGVSARFRTILNKDVSPKHCLFGMYLQQTTKCETIPCQNENDIINLDALCRNCSLSQWTLWSPCNMKCGHGQRERMRVNLIKSDTESCDSRCMTQTINCTDNPPCENNMRMEITTLSNSENTSVSPVTINPDDISEDSTEKCGLSNWSKFTNCSAICGPGFKERTRIILYPTDPQEQKKCRKKLVDRRNCRGRHCSKCNYSPWSEWSLCSSPCGMNRVQQRTRVPENISWTWCTDRLDQRKCVALSC